MRWTVALLLALSLSLAAVASNASTSKVARTCSRMDGDTAAFDRAMKLIADTLRPTPTCPGLCGAATAGCSSRARRFSRRRDRRGVARWRSGVPTWRAPMSLAPTEIAVRIPRAAG